MALVFSYERKPGALPELDTRLSVATHLERSGFLRVSTMVCRATLAPLVDISQVVAINRTALGRGREFDPSCSRHLTASQLAEQTVVCHVE